MEPSGGKIYDVTIIGGGPTGLFGLFYACLRDMEALVVDSLTELGGQLATLYPEKDVYDMAGYPCIKAKDLADAFVKQATMHKKQDFLLGHRVETLQRIGGSDADAAETNGADGAHASPDADSYFELKTDKGTTIHTRTVVICTGPGAFRPNRLPVDGVEPLEERCIHYFVRDKNMFAGKKVVVVGGGDSAMDWVLNLHPVAAEICLVHRRDGFRAHEDSVTKVMSLDNVPKHLFFETKELRVHPETGALEGMLIENNKTGEKIDLAADHIIATLGFVADIGPLKAWGLELKGNSIVVNSKMESNIPGIYAAGDVATFPGKLKLIATGVGEAAIAVNAAKHYLNPKEREQPIHSTALFEKKKPPVAAAT